jgi:signal transduction histidine kinase
MSFSFKTRIAFYYMIATAITMALAFFLIYFVVSETVIRNLDNDLSFEANKHLGEIKIVGDRIQFKNKEEWTEKEHVEVQVNPAFIQLIDGKGLLMDKSPNLKGEYLSFNESKLGSHFNSQINHRVIRQVQVPIEYDGKIRGYILAAMSSESETSTLLMLRNILMFSYLILLIGLYFISRFLAGRSIIPVQKVTNTIARITKNNLNERVELPQNKDEIFDLSMSFNSLLGRIENVLERERQFTSDASHELRTPLATLTGTLEVLIRKARSQQEYEEKVKFSLTEIDKMSTTLEQLLLLARLDSNSAAKNTNLITLPAIVDESLGNFRKQITDKNLKIEFQFDTDKKLEVPTYYTNLIIKNVLSNAIKYSEEDAIINITIDEINNQVVCVIEDSGIGINQEDLGHIFDSFFRSDSLNHKQIKGNGLGLSIVKKCADAINAKLSIESKKEKGTTVTIMF